MSFNVFYPSPYQHLVWNYQKVDVSRLRKAVYLVNWEKLFRNKNIDIQVLIFNEKVLNIFSNSVPNKITACNNKDPIWMNEKIKSKTKFKNQLFKVRIKIGRNEVNFLNLKNYIAELNESALTTKTSYYDNLRKSSNDSTIQTKSYWSVLKSIYNNKKIPLHPPLLINDKFVKIN